MRSFFVFLSKLILVIFFISFTIEFVSDRGLSKLKNSVYNDWNNILQGNLNSEVIIMGSSRGFVSYDSQIISRKLNLSTHNLSFNAAGFQLQQEKLDIYLKYNRKPKIIIQNIDLAHFNTNDVIPDENQFLPFINNFEVNNLLLKYDEKYKVLKYFSLLKYNQNIGLLKLGVVSNFYQNDIENQSTYNGYCPQNIPFKVDYHNLKKLDNILNENVNLNFYKSKLDKIIKFYKKKVGSETQIIFVWAPEHNLRLQAKYEKIYIPIIKELITIDEQNENIHFINFFNDKILNSDEYFYDTFHLNKKGSKIFSTMLSDKITKIVK